MGPVCSAEQRREEGHASEIQNNGGRGRLAKRVHYVHESRAARFSNIAILH